MRREVINKDPSDINYFNFLLMLESVETILIATDDQVCAAFVQLIEVRPSFLEVCFLF